ncbi:MAG: DUF87 domain-containing protein [Anaerolineae bacterium]|nr:DUF87 domain-containing protein [Anaerolineae bacterium]
MDTNGEFYLGGVVDPTTGDRTDAPFLYDPDDLTTHCVVVGMTGSGKTGLCIDLLEEAALNDIPAIMIDPKGDITNTLLHFRDLLPEDFAPWINPDAARRDDKTIEEAAAATASLWKNGLAGWGIDGDRIGRLDKQVNFAVYTPGSDAGLSVSILASLEVPDLDWNANKEALRERISGTVTALLGLVGFKDIDPVRSREHILLANIFEQAWSSGQDLTLSELIIQTQNPPFEKLGVFDVNQFFPEKDRFGLAMDLNNIMASPAFQSWIEGEPLDIGRILYTPEGKPRHSVFYIAHLSEDERMFFVTLLYSAIESWMRGQQGTTSLRALVYFDEIFGYLPPTGNPPSKEPILRMLKQARAFGVGLVLATQNPVDVDYKALSNAGTWFVGKLGTDQDKQRLLDGLTSAMGEGMSRSEYDDIISRLGKRVFLARNVHEKKSHLFGTRWAMNYLAGPIMRNRIPDLNALAGAELTPALAAQPEMVTRPTNAPPPSATPKVDLPGSASRPKVPSVADEYFWPLELRLRDSAEAWHTSLPLDAEEIGVLYRPALLAQAKIRFTNRKYNLATELVRTALVANPDRRGVVRWDDYLFQKSLSERDFARQPQRDARFDTVDTPLSDSTALRSLKSDFIDWGYRDTTVTVRVNEQLKIYAGPDVTDSEFDKMCDDAARDLLEAELKKLQATYDRKEDAIKTKLKREERELAEDEAEHAARKREETGKHIETVIGFFTSKRRSVSSSLTKRRLTEKARLDVEESKQQISEYERELEQLADDEAAAVDDLEEKWAEIADDVDEIEVSPYKKDVYLDLFGIVWLPHYLVKSDERVFDLPAYAPGGKEA